MAGEIKRKTLLLIKENDMEISSFRQCKNDTLKIKRESDKNSWSSKISDAA